MKINHRLNAILIIGLTLGFGFAITVVSAAPPITVTSAVPAEAEQGRQDLLVTINGRGFNKNMDVKFCRSDTSTECKGGGVDVEPGSVRFISSKKLEVIVDVGEEAIVGNFDIEVSSSSGRRGRGIEKFAVLKVGGGDATYSVVITGAVSGTSGETIWREGFVGKNGIGLNVPGTPFTADNNVGQLTDLSFFRMSPPAGPFTLGINCFSMNAFLGQANLKKGKHGQAEGHFWFRGHTDDGVTEVQYLLIAVGKEDDAFVGDWPPSASGPTVMHLDTWETSVSASGRIRNRSCVGDGDFINNLNNLPDEVVITVTLVE